MDLISFEGDDNNNKKGSGNSQESGMSSGNETDPRGHSGGDPGMDEEDDDEEEEEEGEGRLMIREDVMRGSLDKEEMSIDDDRGGGDGGDLEKGRRGKEDFHPHTKRTPPPPQPPVIVMPTLAARTMLDDGGDVDDEEEEDEDEEEDEEDIDQSNFVIVKSPMPSQPMRTWSVEGPTLHIPQPPQRLLQTPKPHVQAPQPYATQQRKPQQVRGQYQKTKVRADQPDMIKDHMFKASHTGMARGVAGATILGPDDVPIKCGRGRGITLNMLMKDGVIEPGGGCLSLEYLGKKFCADLLPNGKIRWQENNEIFNSPSAWASHCKKLVNPSKKSGCGWASIKYKGRKLVSWKSMWCRKQRQNGNPSSKMVSLPPSSLPDDSMDLMRSNPKDMFPKVPDYEANPCTAMKTTPLPAHINQKPVTNGKNKKQTNTDWNSNEFQEEALNLSLKGGHDKGDPENLPKSRQSPHPQGQHQQYHHHHHHHQQKQQQHHHKATPTPPPLPPAPVTTPPSPQTQKIKHKHPPPHQPQEHCSPHSEIIDPKHPRFPLVKHSNLFHRNADQDPNTLVQCETFESYGKFQPFSVSVTTNSMFLIDFHCHLTNSEVLGYLAGRWDQNTQHLNILQAFPCLSRLGDKENAPLIEAEIRHRMNKSGLSLVGWYHSHPHRPASPTIRDIDCQMTYQLKMKGIGSTYHPCLGFIIAPYDKTSKKKESTFQAFWVMPSPLEQPAEYGIPMEVQFSIYQNPSLTEELLTEMKNLVDFYKGSPDVVRFTNIWHQSVTYFDKVKWSLLTKLPQDQDENSSTLEFVRSLLLSMRL